MAPNIWRRDKKIVVRVCVDNRSITRTIGDYDDPDIMDKARKTLDILRGSAPLKYPHSTTIDNILLEYWENRKHVQGLSQNTIKNELCRLRWIHDYWGIHRLGDITPVKIESSIIDLRTNKANSGRTPGPATINLYLYTLSSIFKYCISRGYTDNNPVLAVKRLKTNNERQRYLKRHEYQNLLLACSKAVRNSNKHAKLYRQLMNMIVLSVHTGIRKGELLNIRVEDIDFEARFLTLTHTKSNIKRNIPLPPAALRAIGRELYPRLHDARGYLFMKRGRKLLRFQQRWTRIRRLAGLEDLHWHDLRHTYCSWAIMAGVDTNTVQAVMGHSTSSLTKRYTHLSSSHIMASASILTDWLSNSPNP